MIGTTIGVEEVPMPEATKPVIQLNEDGAIEAAHGITVKTTPRLATPHRKRAIISYFPQAQKLVEEFRLPVQIAVMIILMIATQHDQHLADTLYALGLDIFGDAVSLPRELLNIPTATAGLTFGAGA